MTLQALEVVATMFINGFDSATYPIPINEDLCRYWFFVAKNVLSVSARAKLSFALHYNMLCILAEKSRESHRSIVLPRQERSKYGARVLRVST
jgi:hypothetical protein